MLGASSAGIHDAPRETPQARLIAVLDRDAAARLWRNARAAVRGRLSGAGPVVLRNLFFGHSPDGAVVVCGWVDRERFISNGTVAGTLLERDATHFDRRWRAECRRP